MRAERLKQFINTKIRENECKGADAMLLSSKGIYIKELAEAVFTFGLHKELSFENILDYIKRLSVSVMFYDDVEAQALEKTFGSKNDRLYFSKVSAMTVMYSKSKEYIVYFNETKLDETENVRCALHELGHILLKHLEDIDESNRNKREREANLFADIIIELYSLRSKERGKKQCLN